MGSSLKERMKRSYCVTLSEKISQIFQGKLQMLFYGAHADAQHLGNFLGRKLLIAVHHEDGPALGRHLFYGPQDAYVGLHKLGPVLCAVRGDFLGRTLYALFHQVTLGLENIYGTVAGKDEQLGFEGFRRIQPFPVQPYPHKDGLGQVLGQGTLFYQGPEEAVHLRIPAQEKGVESPPVPGPDSGYQLAVGHFAI